MNENSKAHLKYYFASRISKKLLHFSKIAPGQKQSVFLCLPMAVDLRVLLVWPCFSKNQMYKMCFHLFKRTQHKVIEIVLVAKKCGFNSGICYTLVKIQWNFPTKIDWNHEKNPFLDWIYFFWFVYFCVIDVWHQNRKKSNESHVENVWIMSKASNQWRMLGYKTSSI